VSEGAVQFRTFHDTELGFDCAFTADPTSAEVYCKPPKLIELVFLDAECQQPAAYRYHYTSSNGDAQTGEFVQAVPWGLAGSSGTQASGDAFQVAEQVYTGGFLGSVDQDVFNSLRTLDGGLCVAARVPTSKTVPDVLRLAPIPNAQLVAAKQHVYTVNSEFSVLHVTTHDGAEATLGAATSSGRLCALRGDGPCVPTPVVTSVVSYYVDAACTESMLYTSESVLAEGELYGVHNDRVYALTLATEGFSNVGTLVDPEHPNEQVFTCTAVQIPQLDGYHEYRLGQEVTQTLPAAHEVLLGTGRLLSPWLAVTQTGSDADVLLMPVRTTPGEFKLADDRSCFVQSAEDGTLRCAFLGGPALDAATAAELPQVYAVEL
jgi:hypothetical protein